MTLIDRLGADLPRAPVTVELDDIQATVLRYRPEPYYGTHVMLHVDGRAGRPRVRAQADASCRFGRRLVAGRRAWISVAISYAGLVALGVPRTRCRASRKRSGWGWPRAPASSSTTARTTRSTGSAVRERAHPHRGQRLQRLGADVAPHHGDGAAAVRGISRPDRADRAGLRRSAGRPQPARLQGFDRSARDRGQRRRSPARPGTSRSRPASSSSAIPARPACRFRCRSRTCWDATAPMSGCASTSRASGHSIASCKRSPDREERELLAAKLVGRWRSGAPLTLAPDARRPGARRGPAAEQRLQLCRRSGRPAGAARLATCGA